MAIPIPVITPDAVGAPPAPRPTYNSGEAAAVEGSGALAIARASDRLGEGLGHVAEAFARAKDEFDQSEVMRAVNDLGEFKSSEIDAKALKKTGRNAIGVTATTLQEYDSATQALASTLENKHQKTLFQQHVGQDKEIVRRQLLLHESQQLELQGEIDFRSGLDRYASDAGLRWTVPGAPETALRQGEQALAARAATKGWSDEQTNKELRDFRSRVVASVVNNATAKPEQQGSVFAKAFLDRYSTLSVNPDGSLNPDTKGLVDSDVIRQLSATVRSATLRDTVRREVDRIQLDPVSKPGDSGLPDIDKQIELARKTVKNSDALPEVESQLRELWNIKATNRAHQDDAIASGIINGLDERALNLRPMPTTSELKTDPRWDQMSEKGQRVVLEHVIALQNTEHRERDLALQAARADFYSRAPSDRIRVNPATEYPGLDKQGRDIIQKLVLDSQTAWAKDNGATQEGIHASALTAANKMSYSKRRAGQFVQAIEERLARDFPNKDRPAAKADVDRIIADELLSGRYGFLKFSEPRWEAQKNRHVDWTPSPAEEQIYAPSRAIAPTPAQTPGAAKPNAPSFKPIPDSTRQRIIKALQARGQIATEQNIMDTWMQLPQSRGEP